MRFPSLIRAGVALLVIAVVHAEERRFVFERPLMATRFAITCHGEDEAAAKKAADEAFAAAEEVNRIASDYSPESELMRLPAGKATKVSPVFAELLESSFHHAKLTEGAFDPTLGRLTKLWRESRRTRVLPPDDILTSARDAGGWKHATWDAATSTILLQKPGMQLDLGGIAKGYAADRMLAVMVKAGFSRTCIAAGGDLRLGDPPPGRKAWRVGLQTFDEESPEEVVELVNCAVSTSGDLHQFAEIGGKRYSHILDPATGLGLTERIAVSVISPTATISDALATAACVVGPEKAEALCLKAGATRVIVRTPR
ncbi:FAD:protein FMN transferase [Luteolibacter flavescens]|uniref:FAD:protein FMN transferase n=1 Tax=Luteolibacter flavescens TaxID=1859460 RepID=A0ABT3FNS2_9BACT|nr:FAD:protein FMN transferase [Luteolibacter flavescens]MCW1885215.1 FAD:protein FMN transferase [Luteolibacter flavescens]